MNALGGGIMRCLKPLEVFFAGALLVSSIGARAGESEPALGRFRNTYYYVVLESLYDPLPRVVPLLDLRDQVVATVSAEFKRAISIEGTGRLVDGRVINYAGKKDGTVRWHETRHPYGHGVGDCPLVPFRTVAVDRTRIPLGTTVRIDETVGMVLPDGTNHDGVWVADDVGSAIQGDRIDLFVGDGDRGDVLLGGGITHLRPLTVRLLAPPPANHCSDRVEL